MDACIETLPNFKYIQLDNMHYLCHICGQMLCVRFYIILGYILNISVSGRIVSTELGKNLDLSSLAIQCSESASLQPEGYIFFLRLFSCIAKKDYNLVNSHAYTLVFEKGLEASNWSIASVRSYWISGIQEIASHSDGQEWIKSQGILINSSLSGSKIQFLLT